MSDDQSKKQSSEMTNLIALEELIAKVIAIDLSSQSEQATREVVVNPIIAALGWDTFSPDEVAREYSVSDGRVDYCLREKNRNLILIEVKRADTDLREHQGQLLRYAFTAGAPLAALTNGLIWWLYLPMAGTSWEQRQFFRINFQEQDTEHTAASIHRFLNRQDVVGGKAQEDAQRELENQERERRVRTTLWDAWKHVLNDPQGLLRDLLAETVEEISGDVPDHKEVAEFLEGISGSGEAGTESPPTPLRKRDRPPRTTKLSGLSRGNVAPQNRSSISKKQPFRFSMVDIKAGETLTSRWDNGARCTVLSDSKVKFKNKEMSLSAAALQVVHDKGKNWKAVRGPASWQYNGETLAALRERLSTEN